MTESHLLKTSPHPYPGKLIIVVDDADRENEGDFIMAAEKVSPEAINFMVTHGRGIVCMPVTGQRLDELGIPLMVSRNNESHGTAFAVSIDTKGRTTTGTSAYGSPGTPGPPSPTRRRSGLESFMSFELQSR